MARAAAKREREAHWAWRAANVGQLERTLRWRSPGVAASLAQTRDALWEQQLAARGRIYSPGPRPRPRPSPSSSPDPACGHPLNGESTGALRRQREPGAAEAVPYASVDNGCAGADAEGAGGAPPQGGSAGTAQRRLGSSRSVVGSEVAWEDPTRLEPPRTQAARSGGGVT